MGSPGSAFEDLAVVFASAKFELVEDEAHPEVFGHRLATYRNSEFEYRLVWEGKEEWLLLEMRPAPTSDGEDRAFQEVHLEAIGRAEATAAQIGRLRAALERRIAPDRPFGVEGP